MNEDNDKDLKKNNNMSKEENDNTRKKGESLGKMVISSYFKGIIYGIEIVVALIIGILLLFYKPLLLLGIILLGFLIIFLIKKVNNESFTMFMVLVITIIILLPFIIWLEKEGDQYLTYQTFGYNDNINYKY